MACIESDAPEEISETEFLDRSLSVWKGQTVGATVCYDYDDFHPVPLDLHTACSIGFVNCVQQCVKRKENVDNINKGGWTPLMYASYIGHDLVVSQLLEARACVDIKKKKVPTALSLAASCGNCQVSELLLQKGADIDSVDSKGWTALFHATYSGHHNMVKLLLANGANADTIEPITGMTPLMEACAAGHEIIVQCFLQQGVNIYIKSHCGETALSLAGLNGHTRIVNLLSGYMKKIRSSSTLVQDSHSAMSKGSSSELQKNQERFKQKDVSINEGPETFAWLMNQARLRQQASNTVADEQRHQGQAAAANCTLLDEYLSNCWKDIGNTVNADDDDDDDDGGFSQTGVQTIKSSSGSSGGLLVALGMEQYSDTDVDSWQPAVNMFDPTRDITRGVARLNGDTDDHSGSAMPWSRPNDGDLKALLSEIGLAKYASVFEEQDVDFEMFLTLNDSDLKEIGIELFGPRRKMTNAIARLNNGSHDLHASFEQINSRIVEQLNQVTSELDKARSQLLQESQLRAVAETCLMEDRARWQQLAAAAIDANQRCSHMHDVLNTVCSCSL